MNLQSKNSTVNVSDSDNSQEPVTGKEMKTDPTTSHKLCNNSAVSNLHNIFLSNIHFIEHIKMFTYCNIENYHQFMNYTILPIPM